MNSLVKIARILYFLLFMVFIAFVFIYQKSNDQSVHINIVLLFTFILIPFIDILYSVFAKENTLFQKINTQRASGIAIYIVSVLWIALWGYLSLGLLIFLTLLCVLYIRADGRIFFIWALLVFIYVAFYLVFWVSSNAETLSIYAYYLLIAWVLTNILQNIIPSKYIS